MSRRSQRHEPQTRSPRPQLHPRRRPLLVIVPRRAIAPIVLAIAVAAAVAIAARPRARMQIDRASLLGPAVAAVIAIESADDPGTARAARRSDRDAADRDPAPAPVRARPTPAIPATMNGQWRAGSLPWHRRLRCLVSLIVECVLCACVLTVVVASLRSASIARATARRARRTVARRTRSEARTARSSEVTAAIDRRRSPRLLRVNDPPSILPPAPTAATTMRRAVRSADTRSKITFTRPAKTSRGTRTETISDRSSIRCEAHGTAGHTYSIFLFKPRDRDLDRPRARRKSPHSLACTCAAHAVPPRRRRARARPRPAHAACNCMHIFAVAGMRMIAIRFRSRPSVIGKGPWAGRTRVHER